jgi:hypothetical protein
MDGALPDSGSSAMPPGFSLDKMAGGTLIGTWLNMLFFGMIVCEATTYYKTFGFKGDIWPIRVLVLVILTTDVLGVFACSAIGYLTFVKQYVHLIVLRCHLTSMKIRQLPLLACAVESLHCLCVWQYSHVHFGPVLSHKPMLKNVGSFDSSHCLLTRYSALGTSMCAAFCRF